MIPGKQKHRHILKLPGETGVNFLEQCFKVPSTIEKISGHQNYVYRLVSRYIEDLVQNGQAVLLGFIRLNQVKVAEVQNSRSQGHGPLIPRILESDTGPWRRDPEAIR